MNEKDGRLAQSSVDVQIAKKTVRIQQGGNGFIVKPGTEDHMVFVSFREAADWIGSYFRKLKGGVEVTSAMVGELHEKTGAGLAVCKKALEDANGDAVEAKIALWTKGHIAQGVKP